ncbi:MAG: pre-peptidase C-terminal domain-containing protein [Desulfobacterales bacterium]|nr:pre-peptidase C-terminal domain-containing protein [Desulfobacterales bacterium]
MKRNPKVLSVIAAWVLIGSLCFLAVGTAHAEVRKQVRARVGVITSSNVKDGGGAYPMCAVASMKMLEYAGAKPELIDLEDIDNYCLYDYDVIYFSGGNAAHYYRYYQGSTAQTIRDFIDGGGGYIGICAGAYFACDTITWEGNTTDYPLNLNPGKAATGLRGVGSIHDLANGGKDNPDPWKMTTFRMTQKEYGDSYDVGQIFSIGYLYGPYFENLGSATVVARYDYAGTADNKPAMVKYPYGSGKVFLSGPHPEFEETGTIDASRDWAFGDNYGDANLQGYPVIDPDSEWDLMRDVLAWMCPDKVVYDDVPARSPKTQRAAVYAGLGTSARVVWPAMKMLYDLGIEPYAWDGYGSYEVRRWEWGPPPQNSRFQLCVFPNGNTPLMTWKQPDGTMLFINKQTMEYFVDRTGGHIIAIGGGARTVVGAEGLDFWDSSTYMPGSPVNHGMEGITVTDSTIGINDYDIAYWREPTVADGWDEGPTDPNTIYAGEYTTVAWTASQVSWQPGAVPVAYFDDIGSNYIAMVRYPKGYGKIFLSAVDPFTEEGSLNDDARWDNRSWENATDGYNDRDSEKPLIRNVLNWMGFGIAATPIAERSEQFRGYVDEWDQEMYFYIDVTDTSKPIELTLEWSDTQADFDLYLYNPSNSMVASATTWNHNPERISYSPPTTGRYKIKVYAYSGGSGFNLTAGYKVNTSVTGADRHMECDLSDGALTNYFINVGPSTGTINIQLEWAGDADLDLRLKNPAGQQVASATSGWDNPEHICYPVSGQAGQYEIRVNSYSGSSRYDCHVSYPH